LTGKLPPNHLLQDRYLVLRKIGQGGMAAVYQATDTLQPGTLWAIKEMSDAAIPDGVEREYAIQAFQQEANLLRRLNHPNLPKVVAVFPERGKHYLVMEFVPGQTLAALLESRASPFSEAEVLSWSLQLCDVLGYLHSQSPKVIFRDLKPANIMLTQQGQVKLIDFGIARFFKPGKTKDTLALGTPGFASPEALSGQTDERSDIYSLCVTLHHLLTKHDPVRTMFCLPEVRGINPLVSLEMERILMRGLQNQRENRWRTVYELEAEFARLTGGGPVRQDVFQPAFGADISLAQGSYPAYGSPSYDPLKKRELPPDQAAAIAPLKSSRPTTRLVMAAAQLSGRQLALIGALFIVLIVAGAWLLAPVLDELPVQDWNQVPIIAIFGALGYAAYPRRGIAFLSHAVCSTALVATVWARLGTQGFAWTNLLLAALLSGAFMEIWVAFLPRLKGTRGDDAWLQEAGWLAAMAVIGTTLFFGLVSNWTTGFHPMQWFLSAVFGVVGWFLGDLLKQLMLYRRTGLRRAR